MKVWPRKTPPLAGRRRKWSRGDSNPRAETVNPPRLHRVVVTLLSLFATRNDTLREDHDRRMSRSAEACQPIGTSPMFSAATPSGVKWRLSRPNQAARAYCELADMNLHPFYVSRCSTKAQRRAFPARSIPFGPRCQRATVMAGSMTCQSIIIPAKGCHKGGKC